MRPLYSVGTEGAIALAANTAKSVIGVKAGADFGLDLKKYRIALDGITASAVPGLIEICRCTWATNGPGTNSTSTTVQQAGGRVMASGMTAAAGWTAEPTALTVVDEVPLLTPAGGTIEYDYPLSDEPDCDLAQGFVLRFTFPQVVNARARLWISRI